jgi:outer membrane protein assembly factor BamB
MKHTTVVLSIGLILIAASAVRAGDWPQFRGPNRDGTTSETGLLKQWPSGGPRQIWSVDGLGEGWSSAAIVEDRIFITGAEKKREFLFALDLDGNVKRTTEYGRAYARSFPGARTTPTIDGHRAYVISGAGEVVCLDAGSGDIIWKVNGLDKFAGRQGNWGTAESPLVDEDRVYYTPCGDQTTIVALDKNTGETAWKSKSLEDQSAYVSPIFAEHNGRRILVTVTGRYIIGVDPKSGQMLWSYPYAKNHPTAEREMRLFINAISPVYHDGHIFATSGYDHVGLMLELSADGSEVALKWVSEDFDCHHHGVVLVDDHIYGTNWHDNSKGNWLCADWSTGQIAYDTSWNENKGPVIYADGMLYCYAENDGTVGLAKASPAGFDVVSSFEVTVGKGKHWAHPSIANGRLYLRHGEYLLAYDIQAN